jgi:sugar phosphate isomerase/epimerase
MKRILEIICVSCVLSLATGCATAQEGDEASAAWPLAVRIMSYGNYQEAGWAHLQQIGVKYVFMSAPAQVDVESTQQMLATYGLTPVVFRGSADLSKDTFAEELEPQLAVCEQMGVKYLFLSAKRGDSPLEAAYERLRAAGDAAKEHGVIIGLETHPDLGTNGAVQVETMQAVNHPNIRVNFDTANITYYNENTSAVDELKKSIDYVATVEFKDHTGGLETWDFPVLGKGIVDVPAIITMLREKGYAGPVTLEFEGTKGVELSQEQTLQAIADCVAYARSIGNFN